MLPKNQIKCQKCMSYMKINFIQNKFIRNQSCDRDKPFLIIVSMMLLSAAFNTLYLYLLIQLCSFWFSEIC